MQAKVIELRQLLAERFPPLRPSLEAAPGGLLPTGIEAFDRVLGGGLPRGEFTELVAAGHGSGSALVLHGWLRRMAKEGRYLALIDGSDSFDASAEESEVLSRLLWVRCRRAEEAMQAADVVLRDRNLPCVALDLKLNPPGQLRKIQSSLWHRFKRLLEQTQSTVLVISPRPLVSGAACRVQMQGRLGVEALSQATLPLGHIEFQLMRQSGLDAGIAQAG
jgi:hypothetical protein